MTDGTDKPGPSPGAIDYDLLPGWQLLGGGAFSWRLLASVTDPANPTTAALVLRRETWKAKRPGSVPGWHGIPEDTMALSAKETAKLIEALASRQPAEPVVELALCESEALVLRPNQLYRFEVRPGCARCAELAKNGAL